jgi:hypothetical protein
MTGTPGNSWALANGPRFSRDGASIRRFILPSRINTVNDRPGRHRRGTGCVDMRDPGGVYELDTLSR